MITYRRKRVLIVDDEEDIVWSLQKTIPTKNLQVIVFTASYEEEALSVLEETKIDLIVTDIRMPGISGIELLNTYSKYVSGYWSHSYDHIFIR